MTESFDVIVIGAGPSGVAASVSAAKNGAKVLIIDSNINTGGQVYKPPPESFTKISNKINKEINLQIKQKELLKKSNVKIALNHSVWQITENFKIFAINNESTFIEWQCKILIVATGTYERIIPFPGWTNPGIIGLAATTTLLKSHRILPGKKTLIAGCGPLLAVVASGIIKSGGSVVAIIDNNKSTNWLTSIYPMLSNLWALLDGLKWLKDILLNFIPIYFNSSISNVTLKNGEYLISIKNNKNKKITKIKADSVCVGYGLIPSIDILKSIGAQIYFNNKLSSWIPVLDRYYQTTINNLYSVGDGTGIDGAVPAYEKGLIAGNAASLKLNIINENQFNLVTKNIFKKLKRYQKFGQCMARLMTPNNDILDNLTEETVICRCEDVTLKEINDSIKIGAKDINQLKSWTRCGMGPCQGRTCEDTISRIMSKYSGNREAVGVLTRRFPLKPINMESAVGKFDYEDIVHVEKAPL